jgi:Transposase IS66 family
VDGYAGYRRLAERGDVQLAFCWVHVRRNFYKLATPGPAPIASKRNKGSSSTISTVGFHGIYPDSVGMTSTISRGAINSALNPARS